MSARIISKPKPAHRCNPGWELRWTKDEWLGDACETQRWFDLQLPAGTVVECDCGKVWVAEDNPAPNWFGVVWRPEKRRRRKRLRELSVERDDR